MLLACLHFFTSCPAATNSRLFVPRKVGSVVSRIMGPAATGLMELAAPGLVEPAVSELVKLTKA